MMRWMPRSLFSRLVLVLLAGLVVAQLVGFAIHMQDRSELLLSASGTQSAQRIADIVRLLESSDASGRRQITKVLAEPPLIVSIDRPRLGAIEPGDARTAFFQAMIRRFLGDGWPLEVMAIDGAKPAWVRAHGPGMGPGAMRGRSPPFAGMHEPPHALPAFLAQVRLHDGTLATFDAQLPESSGWPYRLLASLAVLLAAVVVVSLLAVRWATRPLKTLADAADELGRNINRPPWTPAPASRA
jgi:hypothetical protein